MAGISLETDGDSWQGTYGLTVEFIAKDLLRDGAVPGVSAHTQRGTVTGTLEDAGGDYLVIDGQRIRVSDNITGFYIA